MKMKLAGAVILYNPPENIIENILTYINDIEKLYIFDNSHQKKIIIPDKILNKSEYFHSGNNEGIARRLNQAMANAKKDGYDYLLTMDQDSSFKKGELEIYKQLINEENDKPLISMYGVRYFELNKFNVETKINNQILITSGSIINISIALKLKGFDVAFNNSVES